MVHDPLRTVHVYHWDKHHEFISVIMDMKLWWKWFRGQQMGKKQLVNGLDFKFFHIIHLDL